jgi:hypothetical protein
VSCGFTILCGLFTGLLSRGPVEKVTDHVGEFAPNTLGFRAVNVVDVARIVAVPTAFPPLIIPPNRLVRAGFREVFDVIVGGLSRQWDHHCLVFVVRVVRGVVVAVHGAPPRSREPAQGGRSRALVSGHKATVDQQTPSAVVTAPCRIACGVREGWRATPGGAQKD